MIISGSITIIFFVKEEQLVSSLGSCSRGCEFKSHL